MDGIGRYAIESVADVLRCQWPTLTHSPPTPHLSRLAPRPRALLEHGHASREGYCDMAAEGDANKDLKAHLGTYSGFTALMKWGAIVAVIVALIVILLIRA